MSCPKLYLRSRTAESAGDCCARLKAEGRWEGKKARQGVYISEGYTRDDAYYMAINDYSPLDRTAAEPDSEDSEDSEAVKPAEGQGGDSDESEISPELDLSVPDIRRDAYWAYNHIGKDRLTRAHAPSQGAWNMLKHFGANAGTVRDFLEEIAKPMLKSEPKGESYSDDGRELIALCERKRAEFLAEAAREEAA